MSRKDIMTEIERYTKTLHLKPGKLYTKEDLDEECARKYGPTWVWNDNLQVCVNTAAKPTMYRPSEKKTIIRIKL